MSTRMSRILTALTGLLGIVLLGIYFGAPPPLPPADATVAQVVDVGTRYHNGWLLFSWLQAMGSLLSVVFFLALIVMSGAMARLTGILTAVGSAVLLAVVLIEGVLTMDVAVAAANGHPETALTSYDVMGVFIHVFPLVPAPLIFLSLGFALLGSNVLPRALGVSAVVLGSAYAVVGFVGLFTTPGLTLIVLGAQSLWILATAVALVTSKGTSRLPDRKSVV